MTEQPLDFRPSEEARELMRRDERMADELRIVAMLCVQRELADLYFQKEEMHVISWWIDHKLYYAFMLLLQLEYENEEKTFWKRLAAKGQELTAERRKWNEAHEKT